MASISLGLRAKRSALTECLLAPQLAAERDRAIEPNDNSSRLRWRRRWIVLAVHADAFRFSPRAYLQAVIWRMRGLRVRSRSRVSMLAAHSPRTYDLWIAREEPKARSDALNSTPRSSEIVVLPVIDCRNGILGLRDTLNSVSRAGGSTPPILIGGPEGAGAIHIGALRELSGLMNSDEAWLCMLRPGDSLAAGALTMYACAAARSVGSSVIYSDDDLIGSDGRRREPHFKPDWNPDLFEYHDFVTGAAVVRASRRALSAMHGDDGAEALVGAALRQSATPIHLPLVLHHRHGRPRPVVPRKPAKLLSEAPLVSVIVPTRNQVALLRSCVEGLRRTVYPSLETIIVDNGSDEPEALAYLKDLKRNGTPVLRIPGPFNFSLLNNAAVALARGELLCFLNNDVEIIDSDWLKLLVRQAVRPELGAVGARLLYPDGTIQHAGVFVGIGGAAGHGHRLQQAEEPGYFERARLPQRVSGVTGACLVVAREKFLAVGGFDVQEFPVAFNDVDLCLKLGARGWASFYEPRATLIHHESKSRGNDRAKPNRARYAAELAALQRKWHTDKCRDPYHHPHLSSLCEQFLIAV